ncbi:unnamed protein product [Rotaria sp. Silwood2]|nr:unnamed protein product [Rotaria sp. Silwood2]CAF2542292.1 unnamed protein product [Rotaria sp. Silwood2]CAF2794056.1 unnamed protein product [Rotaria sp. Silwood2]CAF2922536.1 unnamed protein product [Rotaria sp. Silwood2]CAF3978265.1 unnamed protein product [Rotaria sp. Silwood2]
MHTNMNCLDELNTNNCYRPTSSIQPISPPAYPMQGPPPPYAIPPPLYPLSSVNIIKTSEPCQSVPVPDDYIPYETLHIRDYMTWSIVNVFLGFMLGLITLMLSLQTKKLKQEGDIKGATRMSKITLICNMLITTVFFGSTAFLFIYIFYVMSFLNNID